VLGNHIRGVTLDGFPSRFVRGARTVGGAQMRSVTLDAVPSRFVRGARAVGGSQMRSVTLDAVPASFVRGASDMTLIIAHADGWMSGDRRVSAGQRAVERLARPKIWRVNGWLFGFAGRLDAHNRVRRVLVPPRPGRYPDRTLADFCDELDPKTWKHTQILACVPGLIIHIGYGGCVYAVRATIDGCGSGSVAGVAAATALISTGMTPGRALRRAHAIAAETDSSCGGGCDVLGPRR